MSLPKHLAIIMDGNGRWAQLRGKPRTFGHIKGARIAKKIITACSNKGISHLTMYAFSTENWLRPANEVMFLMHLLRRYLKKETENLMKQNIRFKTIGEIHRLPEDIQQAIAFATNRTANNTGLILTFAISYGSRQEITLAMKALAEKIKKGELDPSEIDESKVHQEMMTAGQPDPDLIIRTSGEHRLSNFMLWQAAYSEFYFSETLWPDFSVADLDIALLNFMKRERRFGATSQHESAHH